MTEEQFITRNCDSLTTNQPPIVEIKKHLSFTAGGEQIGVVSARFDMSLLAPEFHKLAMIILLAGVHEIKLPITADDPLPSPAKNASTWEKIKEFFSGYGDRG